MELKHGLWGKWVKEFIYNVFIQSIHAILYASIVGLTLKLSDDAETFGGAILTLIIFGIIFKLDGIFRKIFNFVGGKNTIKQVDIYGSIKSAKNMVSDYKNGEGAIYERQQSMQNYFDNNDAQQILADATNRVGEGLVKVKEKAVTGAKDAVLTLDGKKIEVTAEEVEKERERMKNPTLLGKIYNAVQGAAYGAYGFGLELINNVDKKVREKILEISVKIKKDVENLQQNVEMVKRLPIVVKAHDKGKKILNNGLEKAYLTVIDLEKSSKEVLEEIKEKLKGKTKDIVATVYEQEGPQAFLYPVIGSSYMGMSVLASEMYNDRYYYAFQEEKISQRTLRLVLPENDDEAEDEEETETIITEDGTEVIVPKKKKKKKTYKFSRFNFASTRKIVRWTK